MSNTPGSKKPQSQLEANIESKLSVGAREAIVLMSDAFRLGCNWGYIKNTHPDYRDVLTALKEEKGAIKMFQAENGAIVMADKNFLTKVVNDVAPGLINADFIKNAEERAKNETESALKFVKKVADGKSPYVKEKDGYQELQLGILSVNQVNEIRLNGVSYPAFRLNLQEALGLLDTLKNAGINVLVRGVKADGAALWGTPFQLGGNSAALEAAYRGLQISDTDTGVFLSVRLRRVPGFQTPKK